MTQQISLKAVNLSFSSSYFHLILLENRFSSSPASSVCNPVFTLMSYADDHVQIQSRRLTGTFNKNAIKTLVVHGCFSTSSFPLSRVAGDTLVKHLEQKKHVRNETEPRFPHCIQWTCAARVLITDRAVDRVLDPAVGSAGRVRVLYGLQRPRLCLRIKFSCN